MNTIIFRLILLKARLKISILYASCTLMHTDALWCTRHRSICSMLQRASNVNNFYAID